MKPISKGFASNYRIVLVAVALVGCFATLGGRLIFLQVVNRQVWLDRIEEVRSQLTVEHGRRGDILDARGTQLATSRTTRVLGVDPSALLESEEEIQKWPRLAELIGMPYPELEKIFTTKYRRPSPPVAAAAVSSPASRPSLVFNLDPAQSSPPVGEEEKSDADGDVTASAKKPAKDPNVITWMKLVDDIPEAVFEEVKKLDIRGVYSPTSTFRRVYPQNQLASHIVGYVNRQQDPVAGMEFYTDFYLRGQSGWSRGEKDGRGRALAQFNTREVPRANGYSVALSIDLDVQYIVEQELAMIAQKFKPLKATIIVSDPNTGFILGLANYPTFNPNEYNKIPDEEKEREKAIAAQAHNPTRTDALSRRWMRNVAVADVYEPGSVFKIVAAAGALEEGLVTPERMFDCNLASIEYKGRLRDLPDEDHTFDHKLTVAEIISRSSNKGAAQLGVLLGEQRLYRYASAFGFGRILGFPVGGEVDGYLPTPDKWDGLTITRMPMGHAVDCTVLQMHQAMSTIASGGMLILPQVIREIRDASGESVFRWDRIELGRAVSDRTARTVAQMLRGVASKEGTAPEAAIQIGGNDYEAAGKTGTTQKLMPVTLANGQIVKSYSTRNHVASFVGFFPASRPRVAISVIVDDADAHAPNGRAYGKTVAAPSFRTIGEKLIPILNIEPPSHTGRSTFTAAIEGGRR